MSDYIIGYIGCGIVIIAGLLFIVVMFLYFTKSFKDLEHLEECRKLNAEIFKWSSYAKELSFRNKQNEDCLNDLIISNSERDVVFFEFDKGLISLEEFKDTYKRIREKQLTMEINKLADMAEKYDKCN